MSRRALVRFRVSVWSRDPARSDRWDLVETLELTQRDGYFAAKISNLLGVPTPGFWCNRAHTLTNGRLVTVERVR